MLAFLPLFLMLLAVVAIVLLHRLRPGIGYAWLVGNLSALAALGVLLTLRWYLPQQVVIVNWLPFTQFTDSPILALDGSSWPYAFGLSAVIAAVLLTASARLSYQISPWGWVGALLAGIFGLLAIYSANMLTLALAWTAIDLLDAIILSGYSKNRSLGVQTVIAFSARVTGMLLVLVASLVNRSQGIPPTFGVLSPLSALLLLLAAGLRLGVLPLNLPALPDLRARRGLGTVLRMAASASSLVVLARLPALTFSPFLTNILLALTGLGVLYAAVMWLVAPDVIAARPYWLISLAGLAVSCVLGGNPKASLAWGAALLLSGSLLFLYSAQARMTFILPLAGLIGFSGLPFTPAAGGWPAVLRSPFTIWQVVFFLAHFLLMFGYLRFIFRPADRLRDMERWIQVVYPIGLSLLILAQWVVGVIGWSGSFTLGVWWSGLVIGLALVLAGLGLTWFRHQTPDEIGVLRFYLQTSRRVGEGFSTIFSLGWLYRLLWAMYRRIEGGMQVLTGILEGDGGVLWVFVLLALFVSLMRSRLGP